MAYVAPKNTWADDDVYNASDQDIVANDLIDHETRIVAQQAGIAGKLDTSAAAELIRDTIGVTLLPGTNVTITPNDAGDTITIASIGGAGGAIDGGAAAGSGSGTIDGGTA